MKNVLKWLDNHLLEIYTGFLIVFIPLYPKLPLFDAIPGYIVRVRLEDFLILFAIFLWAFYLIRGKIKLFPNPLLKPIVIYLLIGLISVISAIYLTKTIPNEFIHISKSMLHFFRRIEYFSLFFILFSATKSIAQVKRYLFLIVITLIGVIIYGYGQKYAAWPVFSTMNREFSKGLVLYLSENGRVLSTFGGHYDLAAYLVFLLTLMIALYFGVKNRFLKLLIFFISLNAFWLLILTASRISFGAYLGAAFLVIAIIGFHQGVKYWLPRAVAIVLGSLLIMLSFGDLSERFSKTVNIRYFTGKLTDKLPDLMRKPPKQNAVLLVNYKKPATSKTDMPPQPHKPGTTPAASSKKIVPIPGTILFEEIEEGTQSAQTGAPTVYVYDLSGSIRFDEEWPRAMERFKTNIFLGAGYATLTKKTIHQFTEAESTDGDYVRLLGETGILGFLSFLAIFYITLREIIKNLYKVHDKIIFVLYAGWIAATIGYLLNAIFIDVFEASKVAYTYWAYTGIVLATTRLLPKHE